MNTTIVSPCTITTYNCDECDTALIRNLMKGYHREMNGLGSCIEGSLDGVCVRHTQDISLTEAIYKYIEYCDSPWTSGSRVSVYAFKIWHIWFRKWFCRPLGADIFLPSDGILVNKLRKTPPTLVSSMFFGHLCIRFSPDISPRNEGIWN